MRLNSTTTRLPAKLPAWLPIKLLVRSLLLAIGMLLVGCSSTPPKKPAPAAPDPALLAIKAATQDIQHSWDRLARQQQSDGPPPRAFPEPTPNSELSLEVDLDFVGPIETLAQYLGKKVGYEVRIVGGRPTVPVMINVNVEGWRVYDVLVTAGLQGGTQAGIVLKPNKRIIQVVYPGSQGSA